MEWDHDSKEKFEQMISCIPSAMQEFARGKVLEKSIAFAQEEGRTIMSEKDLVDGFFAATPGGFHGPMKSDMEALGIDYEKYGHSNDPWFFRKK